MYWRFLLFNLCLATGSRSMDHNDQLSCDGPPGPKLAAFEDNDGNIVIIEAGNIGLFKPTEMDDYLFDIRDIKFVLYTQSNPEIGQVLIINDIDSVKSSNYDASKSTKFIIHGFLNNGYSPMIQVLKNAFLSQEDVNVIAVDWGAVAYSVLYPLVVYRVPRVGSYVGEFISFLVTQASAAAENIHLIGHSLGAHVAGFAGKTVQEDGYNISRISGLDPALPGFSSSYPTKRLSAHDADYVDCIHTSSTLLGFGCPICQSDFYPNGGKHQPSCSFFLDFFLYGMCSHSMAYYLYESSIDPYNVFPAYSCSKVVSGTPEGCETSATALMGYPANEQYTGIYYVNVGATPPYTPTLSSRILFKDVIMCVNCW